MQIDKMPQQPAIGAGVSDQVHEDALVAVPGGKRLPRYWWLLPAAIAVALTLYYFKPGATDDEPVQPLLVRVEIGDIENAVTEEELLQTV